MNVVNSLREAADAAYLTVSSYMYCTCTWLCMYYNAMYMYICVFVDVHVCVDLGNKWFVVSCMVLCSTHWIETKHNWTLVLSIM